MKYTLLLDQYPLSMFNSGVVRRNGFKDSGLSTIQERLKQATEARALAITDGRLLIRDQGRLMCIMFAK